MLVQGEAGDPDGRGEGDHRGRAYGGAVAPHQAGPALGRRVPAAPVRLADVTRRVPSPGSADRRLRIPVVSPASFRRLAIASLVAVCLIVLTGAAVRLTGSGLGCPDWPSCYQQPADPAALLPPARRVLQPPGHRRARRSLIAVTFLAALRRRPFRRDLTWLTVGPPRRRARPGR